MTFLDFMKTLLGGLLGGGLVEFVEFMIRRSDEKHDRSIEIIAAIDKLDKKIDMVDQKSLERDAQNARTRILKFDDELREKRLHSMEYFMEILRDIDFYEDYCGKHPEFKNTYAVDAVANIKKTFRKCKDENNFI